jgi:hypothetical protein
MGTGMPSNNFFRVVEAGAAVSLALVVAEFVLDRRISAIFPLPQNFAHRHLAAFE